MFLNLNNTVFITNTNLLKLFFLFFFIKLNKHIVDVYKFIFVYLKKDENAFDGVYDG